MSPSAPSYVFSTQTKEFTDMEIVLEAHGQGIFDYDLDLFDDDIHV